MLRTLLEDIAFVAYGVPAKRLEPLLTSKLTPDLQPGPAGDQAFLATVCFRLRVRAPYLDVFRRIPRPGGAAPGDRVIQAATYFTYVKRDDAPSIYVFRTVIDPPFLGSLAQLIIPSAGPASAGARRSVVGRLRTDRSRGIDATANAAGALRYLLSAPDGGIELELRRSPAEESPSGEPTRAAAEPASAKAAGLPGSPELAVADGSSEEAPAPAVPSTASFLTQRPQVHFWIRGRYLWKTPVLYREPEIYEAVPGRIRIPLWQEMGLLSAAEIESPIAAFISPGVSVGWMAPRPDISL